MRQMVCDSCGTSTRIAPDWPSPENWRAIEVKAGNLMFDGHACSLMCLKGALSKLCEQVESEVQRRTEQAQASGQCT
jgi:hypothetical protein